MDSIVQTAFAPVRETPTYRLSTCSINPADVRIDARELFGMWRLAHRYGDADPRLEAINTLHFRLDDASADLRALDPDATLREIYRDELNHLED